MQQATECKNCIFKQYSCKAICARRTEAPKTAMWGHDSFKGPSPFPRRT